MSFDIDGLFEFCRKEIIEFSKAHPNEMFYGFAIDASLLCLNSEEQFRSALAEFEGRWRTLPADEVAEFRANTGDWAYQGFADMSSHQAWDEKLYDDHYNEAMDAEEFNTKHTPYALAMSELVRQLERSDVFQSLRRTKDFYVTWVEHNY